MHGTDSPGQSIPTSWAGTQEPGRTFTEPRARGVAQKQPPARGHPLPALTAVGSVLLCHDVVLGYRSMRAVSTVSCLPLQWHNFRLSVPLAAVCDAGRALPLWKLLRLTLDIPRAWQLPSEFHGIG